jgi:hypothetical protein
MIFRLYSCPSEIIHGFDVDACGVLWDGTNLWATKRTVYALENMTNHFDPSRSSPSYAYRLSKYQCKGFKIILPLFDQSMILSHRIHTFWNSLKTLDSRIEREVDDNDNHHPEECRDPVTLFERCMFHIRKRNRIMSRKEIHKLIDHYILAEDSDINEYGIMTRKLLGTDSYRIRYLDDGVSIRSILMKLIPRDPVSILILASQYGYHTSLWTCSDYSSKFNEDKNILSVEKAIIDIEWIEQDPMAQISSTLYPTPIQDISDWYKTSPFISNEYGSLTHIDPLDISKISAPRSSTMPDKYSAKGVYIFDELVEDDEIPDFNEFDNFGDVII